MIPSGCSSHQTVFEVERDDEAETVVFWKVSESFQGELSCHAVRAGANRHDVCLWKARRPCKLCGIPALIYFGGVLPNLSLYVVSCFLAVLSVFVLEFRFTDIVGVIEHKKLLLERSRAVREPALSMAFTNPSRRQTGVHLELKSRWQAADFAEEKIEHSRSVHRLRMHTMGLELGLLDEVRWTAKDPHVGDLCWSWLQLRCSVEVKVLAQPELSGSDVLGKLRTMPNRRVNTTVRGQVRPNQNC